MDGAVKRVAGVVALVAGLSCSDVSAPTRRECSPEVGPGAACAYEFRHPDGFVFHWPRDRMPVRIWVEQPARLGEFVVQGIELWRSALLYEELQAVIEADSSTADVFVREGPPRIADPAGPACGGASEAQFTLSDTVVNGDTLAPLQLLGPIQSFVSARQGADQSEVVPCFRIIVAHELGHAFGILAHSDDVADLMAPSPTTRFLTERDRTTFEVLYHTPPSIKPPRR